MVSLLRSKTKRKSSTAATLPVRSSEMEIEMHPQAFTNKGLASDAVALEVNDNEIAEPKETGDSTTQAEIQFST